MIHIKENRFHHIENEFTEELSKKPKNRIFCPSYGRPKLLFSTEKKALNFIKFNAIEIKNESGYCPVRAYYCHNCGGWHVTSKESSKHKSLYRNISIEYNYLENVRV